MYSHQILSLRDYTNSMGKVSKTDTKHWSMGLTAPSVEHILNNYTEILEKFPEDERYNLYFTVAECLEGSKRVMARQRVLPFDIDQMDMNQMDDVIDAFHAVMRMELGQVGVVNSGNGLHFYIGVKDFDDPDIYAKHRDIYKAMCTAVNAELHARKLAGKADTSVYDGARLMRLPGSLNVKEGRATRVSKVIYSSIRYFDLDILELSKLVNFASSESVPEAGALKRFSAPDPEGVLSCNLVLKAKTKPKDITEQEWYALASFIPLIEDGRQVFHDISKLDVERYDYNTADGKIDQAIAASGPRTCENINSFSEACKGCPHRGKVKSPILIVTQNYIKTLSTNFHETRMDVNGNMSYGKLNIEDYYKWFSRTYDYIVDKKSLVFYFYNGKFWQRKERVDVEAIARTKLGKLSTNAKVQELTKHLEVNERHLRESDWVVGHKDGLFNLLNGVLDINTMEMIPHNKEHGFTYVMPHEYYPGMATPVFDKFITECTGGDEMMKQFVLEYCGYCISGDDYWYQKALFIVGPGGNGKTVLSNLLQDILGDEGCSNVPLGKLSDPTQVSAMFGKALNACDEVTDREMQTNNFKNATGEGKLNARNLYENAYSFTNRAKFLITCNQMPNTTDMSEGFTRRIVRVDFKRSFTKENIADVNLPKKLRVEIPGIIEKLALAYKEMKARGRGVNNDYTEETRAHLLNGDDLVDFAEDYLRPVPDFVTPKKDVYQAYLDYCMDIRAKPLTKRTFMISIVNTCNQLGIRIEECRTKDGIERNRAFKHIQLRKSKDVDKL